MSDQTFEYEVLEVKKIEKKGFWPTLTGSIKLLLIFLEAKLKKTLYIKASFKFLWDYLSLLKQLLIVVSHLFKAFKILFRTIKRNFIYVVTVAFFNVCIYHIFKQLIISYNGQF